jgi:hypothetical protein
MKNIKETIKNIIKEEGDYKTFFKKALEKAGKSIPSMSDEEKKSFFNKIDAAWDAKGEKNEELTKKQQKLDIDNNGEIDSTDLEKVRDGELNEEFKHLIHVDTPAQIGSKSTASQIMALAKKGVRSKEIGLEMGFTGDTKSATDTFQKIKNRIYFELDARNESINEATVIVRNKKTGEENEVLSGRGKGDLIIAMNALQKAAPSHMKYSIKESVNEVDDVDKMWVVTKNKGQAYQISKKAYMANKDRYIVAGNRAQANTYARGVRDKLKPNAVNEGRKVFKVNPQIGKAKYSISSHDGVKTHKDGSDFYDMEIFNNKVDLEKGIKKYTSNGFVKESVNEGKYYAFFNNKKHEIEGKDLWDAKQKAILQLKVPKSKVGYLAIVNASEHDRGSYRFESKINEGNAFGAAVTAAKKAGQKEFEFNGKMYKVKKGSYEKNGGVANDTSVN